MWSFHVFMPRCHQLFPSNPLRIHSITSRCQLIIMDILMKQTSDINGISSSYQSSTSVHDMIRILSGNMRNQAYRFQAIMSFQSWNRQEADYQYQLWSFKIAYSSPTRTKHWGLSPAYPTKGRRHSPWLVRPHRATLSCPLDCFCWSDWTAF